MSLSKNSKMLQFINYRVRITLDDRRTLVGRFLAFDKHMNVVLSDCEEFRKAKKTVSITTVEVAQQNDKTHPNFYVQQKDERRALGLVLLRGETVVSMAVESPPAPKKGKRSAAVAGLAMSDRSAPGRSMPMTALAGQAAGVGGSVQPQLAAQPRMYAMPPYGRGAAIGMAGVGRGVSPPAYVVPPPTGRGMVSFVIVEYVFCVLNEF